MIIYGDHCLLLQTITGMVCAKIYIKVCIRNQFITIHKSTGKCWQGSSNKYTVL
jgi:hypothetical protein